MKGKKLTLEEVLELKDGSMVWVEDADEGDEQVGTIIKDDDMLNLDDGGWFYLSDLPLAEYVKFYEWIDEGYSNPMMLFEEDNCGYNINSMAQEICNLRGINLTDDNIDKIMKEFEVK